jgi:3-hydroxybutyryl-CoA dehydrogenase
LEQQMSIERVGVVGAGTMGAGIAEVCLLGGFETVVVESTAEFADAGRARMSASLDKAHSRDKITEEQRADAEARLTVSSDLNAMESVDIVIEAIVEEYNAKAEVFALLDKILPERAVMATNTSSIPIIDLAVTTERPDKVLGLHFFNPAQVQPLVEVIRCLTTSDETVVIADDFAISGLGKQIIHTRDRAGFVVNRLLVPYLLRAISMLDRGMVTKEDIDLGMRAGCAHPMGPLELCDLIGLDTIKAVADVMHAEYHERSHAAPPLLKRMVAAGHLGRKTGIGFYTYD